MRYGCIRPIVAAAWGVSVVGAVGCINPKSIPDAEPPPLRSTAEIIETIAANSRLLDRALWSAGVAVTARFRDSHDREHVYNLDSNFLFAGPASLRMDLRPGLGDRVMQIGSNADDYWVWIEPELGMMRWGRHRHVGKPCAEHLAIRPDQVAAALGVGDLRSPAAGVIGPARVYGKTYDKLVYWRVVPDGGYVVDHEYWVDRVRPYLIRVVLFRDGFGRRAMSAFLDDYRPAWDGGPLFAHHINIDWPQDDGKFTMRIGRMRGVEDVSPAKFARPGVDDLPADVTDIVQVDAACDTPDEPAGPGPGSRITPQNGGD
ncbi:MAG: hypothetical protein ACE5F9_07625 [Phycisphaerae bacterium]